MSTLQCQLFNPPYSGSYRILNTEFVEGCMLSVEPLACVTEAAASHGSTVPRSPQKKCQCRLYLCVFMGICTWVNVEKNTLYPF